MNYWEHQNHSFSWQQNHIMFVFICDHYHRNSSCPLQPYNPTPIPSLYFPSSLSQATNIDCTIPTLPSYLSPFPSPSLPYPSPLLPPLSSLSSPPSRPPPQHLPTPSPLSSPYPPNPLRTDQSPCVDSRSATTPISHSFPAVAASSLSIQQIYMVSDQRRTCDICFMTGCASPVFNRKKKKKTRQLST